MVFLYSVSKFHEEMRQALNVLIPSHNLLIQFHLFVSAGRPFVHTTFINNTYNLSS